MNHVDMAVFAFRCAIIGNIFVYLLTNGRMILYPLGRWITNMTVAKGRLNWVHKLLTCSKCFGGQLSLWGYPIMAVEKYDSAQHILCICYTIFIAMIINFIIKKIDE